MYLSDRPTCPSAIQLTEDDDDSYCSAMDEVPLVVDGYERESERQRQRQRQREREGEISREGGREGGTDRQTDRATREGGREGESRRAIIASLHGKTTG